MSMHVYHIYVHYYYFDLITGVPPVRVYVIYYTNRSMDEQGKVHLDNMAAQSLTKSTKHLYRELTLWILYRICVYVMCFFPLLFVEKGKRKSQRGRAIMIHIKYVKILSWVVRLIASTFVLVTPTLAE